MLQRLAHILGRMDGLPVDGKKPVSHLHTGSLGIGAFVKGSYRDPIAQQLQTYHLPDGDQCLHRTGCDGEDIKKVDCRYEAEKFSFHCAALLFVCALNMAKHCDL